MKILLILILAILSGIAYRAGGSGNYPRWVREVGVGVSIILGLFVLFLFNWWSLLIMGTVWIESTYFKRKGTNARLVNWVLVGMSFSLVALPWLIGDHGRHWFGFMIRSIVCTVLTAVWSQLIGNAVIEENGRGFIQIITLPLLLI